MNEVKSNSRRYELEAERDVAHRKASVARIDVDAGRIARAAVESELARVQHALAVSEEAKRKKEYEVSRLSIERVSLLLEFGTSKDEMSALWA